MEDREASSEIEGSSPQEFDMSAIIAKENAHGFSLPKFIRSRLDKLTDISKVEFYVYDNLEKDHGLFSPDVSDTLKLHLNTTSKTDKDSRDIFTQQGAKLGWFLGRAVESTLFSIATSDNSTNISAKFATAVSSYLSVFVFDDAIGSSSTLIPSKFQGIASNVSEVVYKYKTLYSRKKDMEDFLRSEGVIHD